MTYECLWEVMWYRRRVYDLTRDTFQKLGFDVGMEAFISLEKKGIIILELDLSKVPAEDLCKVKFIIWGMRTIDFIQKIGRSAPRIKIVY